VPRATCSVARCKQLLLGRRQRPRCKLRTRRDWRRWRPRRAFTCAVVMVCTLSYPRAHSATVTEFRRAESEAETAAALMRATTLVAATRKRAATVVLQ
jgi:hypothetical protein